MSNQRTGEEIFLSLKEQFKQSERKIEILDPVAGKADIVKAKFEVPDNTLWGVILYNTGGIVFDGWIRFLGSGERDIASWNETLNIDGYTVVADDVLGGLFGLCKETNIIHYFAPDTLEWEDMDVSFSNLVEWLVEGDVDYFYELFRWDNWEEEVKKLNFSEGVAFYPFLWTESEEERSRKVTSLEEIVKLSFEMQDQLG